MGSDDSACWLAAIAGRLRAARRASGLSVRAAADAAGVNASTIQRAEAGTTDCGINVYRRIAVAVGSDLHKIIPPTA